MRKKELKDILRISILESYHTLSNHLDDVRCKNHYHKLRELLDRLGQFKHG